MNAVLALENGTWYRGSAAGALGEARGEVVFNTSMTGYQEVLTDPSYTGQIVTMTCPQIGNYGVAAADVESRAPQVAGFVMREPSPVASNWRASGTLGDYLTRHHIVAIGDIDTRALTRVLRSAGVMRGVIATGQVEPERLVEQAQRIPRMEGSDLVRGVTCDAPFEWVEGEEVDERSSGNDGEFFVEPLRRAGRRLRVAAYDFGIKWNILRRLVAIGGRVSVVPGRLGADAILAMKPDGILVSDLLYTVVDPRVTAD